MHRACQPLSRPFELGCLTPLGGAGPHDYRVMATINKGMALVSAMPNNIYLYEPTLLLLGGCCRRATSSAELLLRQRLRVL